MRQPKRRIRVGSVKMLRQKSISARKATRKMHQRLQRSERMKDCSLTHLVVVTDLKRAVWWNVENKSKRRHNESFQSEFLAYFQEPYCRRERDGRIASIKLCQGKLCVYKREESGKGSISVAEKETIRYSKDKGQHQDTGRDHICDKGEIFFPQVE